MTNLTSNKVLNELRSGKKIYLGGDTFVRMVRGIIIASGLKEVCYSGKIINGCLQNAKFSKIDVIISKKQLGKLICHFK